MTNSDEMSTCMYKPCSRHIGLYEKIIKYSTPRPSHSPSHRYPSPWSHTHPLPTHTHTHTKETKIHTQPLTAPASKPGHQTLWGQRGGEENLGGKFLKMCAKHAEICHFYAEIIRFSVTLTHGGKLGGKKLWGPMPPVALPLHNMHFNSKWKQQYP